MTKKKEKKLNYLTQEEIKEKIKNLHLTQRGEKNLDSSFSGCHLGDWYSENDKGKVEKEYHINENIFKGLDLSGANFSNSKISYLSFEGTNLSGVNFQGTKFNAKIDRYTNFEGADFRGAEYDIQKFNEKQKEQIIFTDKDYEDFQKSLQEENKELKEITKNTSEEQTNKLTESFEKLEKKFGIEEIRWLIVSFFAFICLLFFFAIPLLDIFMYQNTYKIIFWSIIVIVGLIFTIATMAISINAPKEENTNGFWKEIGLFIKKGWGIFLYAFLVVFSLNKYLDTLGTPDKSVFNLDKNYALIPFGILLTTFLYFSVYQYSKSKKLRIENQNKIAVLHGFIALRTDTGTDFKKELFYNNIANVVFDKIYQEKETNLPIDKIIDLVNLVNKKQ